jgi:hypothetical protein
VIADILWVFPGMSEERIEALPLEQLLKRHEQSVERKTADRNHMTQTMAQLMAAMRGG